MPRRNGKPGEECSIRGSSKCNCRGRFGDHPAWARFKLWTRRNGGSPTASREIATIYGPRRARRLLVGAGWCRMFDVSTGIHRAERRERTKPACEQWALHCAGPDDSLGWTSIVHGSLGIDAESRSEEHTSELQSLMRISYAVFCLKKKTKKTNTTTHN